MPDYSIIACNEIADSQQEGVSLKGGQTATVKLICTWENRHLLQADLVGNQRPWPHGGFTVPPICVSTTCVGLPGTAFYQDGQAGYYAEAEVTANYSTDIVDLISETLEPNTEFLTLDYKRFRWGAANGLPLLEGEAPGILYKNMNIVRTVYNVPELPAAILTCMGCCNVASYSSAMLGLTFPAETLLFNPPSPTRTITNMSSGNWTLGLKFSYKPNGWNKFWNAKTQTWLRFYEVTSGLVYNNYPLADFSDLLY